MDIEQIVTQIKCLDEQIKAMLLIEDRATRKQYLENMKLHIDILKAWAGITSTEASALPIPGVFDTVCDSCGHPFTDDVFCSKCQDKKID